MPSDSRKQRAATARKQQPSTAAAGRERIAARPPAFRNEGAWLVAILGVTALLYTPALRNDFVFDDHDMIVHNRFLGDWSYLWKSLVNDSWWFRDPSHLPQGSFYRPLQDIWFWINFRLFGLEPAGWHAAMVALHLLVVWLVFRVASLLAGSRKTGLLAAALFALMPPHAEAIVWASAIPLPLCAAFELGAFEFYLQANSSPEPSQRQGRLSALSFVLFVGALLSHEGAAAFPIFIAAHAFIMGSASTEEPSSNLAIRARSAINAAWPYAAEVAAYLVVRWLVLGFINRPNPYSHMTALEVALTMPSAVATYVMMLLLPWNAGPAHRMDIVDSVASSGFFLPVAGLLAVCAIGYLLLRNLPRRRLYLFCALWIPVALAPMLNLGGLLAQSAIQDRYLYFPSVGLCIIAADLVIEFSQRSDTWNHAVWAATGVVAFCFAIALFSVQKFWHDDVAMFQRCVDTVPDTELWHQRLGLALEAVNDFSRAHSELETAVKLAPDNGTDRYDLGMVDDRLGNHSLGISEMIDGLKRINDPPPSVFSQLAMVADAAGETEQAEQVLKQLEALPKGAESASLTRAQLMRSHGDITGAESVLRDFLRSHPDNAQAMVSLGMTLSAQQRNDEALAIFRNAIAIAPQDPTLHYLTALTLHNMGRDREAFSEGSIALAGAPNDPNARALMNAIERGGAH
ncbi:MAG TPA: tetratricopeptide repeat protein [Candidatus Binataceae bacterium]|nr:tetratricopeptide repeat protein [Candidatus Binataceae bacterium]